MNYLSELEVSTTLSSDNLDYLANNFEQLCVAYQLPAEQQNIYKEELWRRHQEPQRHYHNLSHLYNLLRLLEHFQADIQQKKILQLVTWYHDSIYDPASKKNEQLSARLATTHWRDILPKFQHQQLEAYIIATTQHYPQTQEEDERLFLDFDLSILAATPTVYQAYSQAIAAEYTSVYPLEVYQMGRQQVLQSFLARPQIYYSKPFVEQYETTARANLAAELQALQ